MAQPTLFRLTRDLREPFPTPSSPAGLTVRALIAVDVPRVYALMNLAYGGRFGDVPDFETWWSTTRNDSEYDPTFCVVAADESGHPVAFALVWNSAFIKDFVVHPDWQRRGLGTALMTEIFARLKARGFDEVALKVNAENETARRLYAWMGFVG